MSDWTLGAIKARNIAINALCDQQDCRHLFVFNLDQLIAGVGADYKLADIPPMTCPQCGLSPLTIRLAFAEPPPADED